MKYTILILQEDRGMQRTHRNPVDDASPEFWAGRKVAETHKALLWQLLNDDPTCPSRLVLHALAETQVQISVTLRQINRLRRAWAATPRRLAKKNLRLRESWSRFHPVCHSSAGMCWPMGSTNSRPLTRL